MKKLIASLLFFGSFSVAMAQVPSPSPWTAFRNAFGNLFVGPPVQVFIPPAIQAVNTAVDAVRAVTPATGDQRYCRNQDPVSESYCAQGRGDTGNGTRCYTLSGCIGATDNPRNPCRPAPRCTSSIPTPPLTIAGTVSISCPRPSTGPMSGCENNPYCREMMMGWRTSNLGFADVSGMPAGGKAPYGRVSGVGRFYFDLYPAPSYTISVTDANNVSASKSIKTPAGACRPPQESECVMLASRLKILVASGEMTIEQMEEKCKSAQCWIDGPSVGSGYCGDPHPYRQ